MPARATTRRSRADGLTRVFMCSVSGTEVKQELSLRHFSANTGARAAAWHTDCARASVMQQRRHSSARVAIAVGLTLVLGTAGSSANTGPNVGPTAAVTHRPAPSATPDPSTMPVPAPSRPGPAPEPPHVAFGLHPPVPLAGHTARISRVGQ